MNPTKIIEEPFRVPTGANPVLMCKCDDGEYYTFRELASLKGFTSNVFYERFRRNGWNGMARGLGRQRSGPRKC